MSISQRILLIQLRRIGDVLMCTPAIRAIKTHFINAHISFLVEPPGNQILVNNPYIDEILVFNRNWQISKYMEFIYTLYKRHFDIVVDFMSNPRTALITLLSGAKYRLGFDFRYRSMCYNEKVKLTSTMKDTYSALHKLYLLHPLGITSDNWQIEFNCTDDDYVYAEQIAKKLNISEDEFVISLSPVSRHKHRMWQLEKFAWVADRLIEKYHAKILFIWGPNEKDVIDITKGYIKYKDNIIDDYDVPTLTQLRALFEKVDLHIGVDNGLRHIAISAQVPTVTIFGPTNPYNWTPPDNSLHRFLQYDPGCKITCDTSECKEYQCITGISEYKYLTEIEDLIRYMRIK